MCTWSLQTGGWESVPVCSDEPRGAAEMGGDSAEQHQVGQLLRGFWVRLLRHRKGSPSEPKGLQVLILWSVIY